MGSGVLTNVVSRNLAFGYDTGYGVADNHTKTRFYKGRPTANSISTALPSHGGWGGGYTLVDADTNTFDFTVNNFSGNPGAGWRSFTWDMTSFSGSNVTISATFERKIGSSGDMAWIMMGQVNSYTNGQAAGGYLGYSAASERYQKTTSTKETISWSGVVGSTGTANSPTGHIGFTVWINNGVPGTNSTVRVSNIMIEIGKTPNVASPFVETSRATGSDGDAEGALIDISNYLHGPVTFKSSIPLDTTASNIISFDSSGQPIFDGTNDRIDINKNFGVCDYYTFEWVENASSTHRMPIANRTNTNFYKYGAYSWRYKHGGTLGEFYHTTGATSGWHHWAVTYDGSTIKVYQDNISLGTRSSSGSADFSDGFRVGYWSALGNYAFNGPIPVMRFYKTALTDAEVEKNFKAYKNRFNI